MAVIKRKPTSPGRRFVVSVVNKELHKGAPFAALTQSKKRIDGRNNAGRITTRHRGGGHKQRYRIIDFKRNKDGIPATVERLEYDLLLLAIFLLVALFTILNYNQKVEQFWLAQLVQQFN
jgi:large subunit ribosomal protein L2